MDFSLITVHRFYFPHFFHWYSLKTQKHMLIMVASNIRFHLKMTFLHSTGRNFNLAPSDRKKTSSNLIMGSNPNFVTTVFVSFFQGLMKPMDRSCFGFFHCVGKICCLAKVNHLAPAQKQTLTNRLERITVDNERTGIVIKVNKLLAQSKATLRYMWAISYGIGAG